MTRRAFTLIEVMAIVLLLGLLSMAVTWSLADRHIAARMSDVTDQLIYMDRMAREHARRFNRPSVIRLNVSEGTVLRLGASPSDDRSHTYRLPEGFAFEKIVTAQQQVDAGEIDIPCSTHGYTPSYAVRVVGPQHGRWVLIAGMTGRAIQTQSEDEVDEIFKLLQPTGPDTH